MAFVATFCNALTGEPLHRFTPSAFPWARALSAGSQGSVSIPLDGAFGKSDLRALSAPWEHLVELSLDDAPLFLGYVSGRDYARGTSSLTLQLADVWAMWEMRAAWDRGAASIPKWKATANLTRAQHVTQAINRTLTTGPTSPSRSMPVTVPSINGGGGTVDVDHFGYQLEMVSDVLQVMLDDGLDVYFQPRRSGGNSEWILRAGMDWATTTVHEFYVTAQDTTVSAFSESVDGSRMANRSYRTGEGSEEDLLIGSSVHSGSSFPLRERVASNTDITKVSRLNSLAAEDTRRFRLPTSQWSFQVRIADSPDVGDTVRLYFDGDPIIPNGWHERRVVGVSGDVAEFVTVTVQPTGGA